MGICNTACQQAGYDYYDTGFNYSGTGIDPRWRCERYSSGYDGGGGMS
jgi:hypothetical protein